MSDLGKPEDASERLFSPAIISKRNEKILKCTDQGLRGIIYNNWPRAFELGTLL